MGTDHPVLRRINTRCSHPGPKTQPVPALQQAPHRQGRHRRRRRRQLRMCQQSRRRPPPTQTKVIGVISVGLPRSKLGTFGSPENRNLSRRTPRKDFCVPIPPSPTWACSQFLRARVRSFQKAALLALPFRVFGRYVASSRHV